MIDQIGAILLTTACAVLIGVPVVLSPARLRAKGFVLAVSAAWSGMIVTVATSGGFEAGAFGPVPGPGIAFLVLLALLLAGWLVLPGFREALMAVPLPVLLALNVARVFGALFLVLAAQGRLSTTFATSAGWGDVATGLLAVPLAVMAIHHDGHYRGLIAAWNAFGALDLVAAIALGVLSAPGTPFQVFTDGPGTGAMGEMPWALVPSLLVPVYLLVHLTIAAKLMEMRRSATGAATVA